MYVIENCKQWGEKTPNHHGIQLYFALFKKAGMPDRKYMSHISENCFGKRSDQKSINKGLGVYLGNRADTINHYKKSGQNFRKELESSQESE